MKYWKFSPGRGARFWPYCKKNNIAAIGWSRVGSLRSYHILEELSKAFDLERTHARRGWGSRKWNTGDTQLWNYKTVCGINDRIVAYGKGHVLSVGTINGKYCFDDEHVIDENWSDPYSHRRKVEWHQGTKRNIKNNERIYKELNKQLTFYEITDKYALTYIKNLVS